VPIPVVYDGVDLGPVYRIDILVEELVVVEIKAIAKVLPVHEAQLLSQLRLSGLPVGLLINFNVSRLKDGITRRVNGLSPSH
jgi:GxxExxY protein